MPTGGSWIHTRAPAAPQAWQQRGLHGGDPRSSAETGTGSGSTLMDWQAAGWLALASVLIPLGGVATSH